MADTTTNSALRVQQWDDQYFLEYVRANRFKRYMGTSENSVIQIKEDLTKKPGDRIAIPLVTRLTGSGVTGNAVLEGNEEQLGNYGHLITIDTYRNAVVVTDHEQKKNVIDLRNAAKTQLKTWSMELLRDHIITALGSFRSGDTVYAYADASEAVKDAFLAANSDRFLFGSAKSNNASNDHSAALANIDSTNDKLSPEMVSLAKRMAQTADRHIRPIKVGEDEEWFVMFANSFAFRDLKTNSTMTQANREAWQRYNGGMNGGSNPLFRDGDLVWDGVIIREVPEIGVISGVGASSIDVAPNYLCGAQSVGVAWGQRPKSTVNNTDYEFRKGVGIQEMHGVEKLVFDGVQQGVVTVYASGVADA